MQNLTVTWRHGRPCLPPLAFPPCLPLPLSRPIFSPCVLVLCLSSNLVCAWPLHALPLLLAMGTRQLVGCHGCRLVLVLLVLGQLCVAVAGGRVKRTFLLNTKERSVEQAAEVCSRSGLVLADVQSEADQAQLDALRRSLPGGNAAAMWCVLIRYTIFTHKATITTLASSKRGCNRIAQC